MDKDAGASWSFEELNSIASVFSSYSWSVLPVIRSLMSDTQSWTLKTVWSMSDGWEDLWSWESSAKGWYSVQWLCNISESGSMYRTKRMGPRTEPWGSPDWRTAGSDWKLFTELTVWKVWLKPVESRSRNTKVILQTIQKNVVVDSVKCSWQVQ